MDPIIAIYGSPRKNGNSAALLKQAVAGARSEGAGQFLKLELKLKYYVISAHPNLIS